MSDEFYNLIFQLLQFETLSNQGSASSLSANKFKRVSSNRSSSSEKYGRPELVTKSNVMPPTNQKSVIAPSQSEKASRKVFHSSSGRELPTVNEWDAKLTMGQKGKFSN